MSTGWLVASPYLPDAAALLADSKAESELRLPVHARGNPVDSVNDLSPK